MAATTLGELSARLNPDGPVRAFADYEEVRRAVERTSEMIGAAAIEAAERLHPSITAIGQALLAGSARARADPISRLSPALDQMEAIARAEAAWGRWAPVFERAEATATLMEHIEAATRVAASPTYQSRPSPGHERK